MNASLTYSVIFPDRSFVASEMSTIVPADPDWQMRKLSEGLLSVWTTTVPILRR